MLLLIINDANETINNTDRNNSNSNTSNSNNISQASRRGRDKRVFAKGPQVPYMV